MWVSPDQLGTMIQEATAKTAHDVAEATATAMNRQARNQFDAVINMAVEKCTEIYGDRLKAAEDAIVDLINSDDRETRVQIANEYLARLKEIENA